MPANVEDWERMAAYRDKKQGYNGDLWHRALNGPALFRTMGPVAGLRVPNLASGNGYLSRKHASHGAQVTAIDASTPVVAQAGDRESRQPLGIICHVAKAARLDMLTDHAFDLVVCHMGLMDFADAEGAVHEVSWVLAPRGRFVASLAHSCFDPLGAALWAVERMAGESPTVWHEVSRYRESFQGSYSWRIAPDERMQTRA